MQSDIRIKVIQPAGPEMPDRQSGKLLRISELDIPNEYLGPARAVLLIQQKYRPILAHPEAYPGEITRLNTATGGDEHNPHTRIDMEANSVFFDTIGLNPSNRLKTFFVEEKHAFTDARGNILTPEQLATAEEFAVADLIDGTNDIGGRDSFGNLHKTQSSGVTVFTREGKLKFGIVASLVNDSVMIFDGQKMRYFSVNPDGKFKEIEPQIMPSPPDGRLTLATLRRRITEFPKEYRKLFNALNISPVSENLFETSGGIGALSMIGLGERQVDIMADLFKGQPLHDCLVFMRMLKATGLAEIVDGSGNEIDFDGIAKNWLDPNSPTHDLERVKFSASTMGGRLSDRIIRFTNQ